MKSFQIIAVVLATVLSTPLHANEKQEPSPGAVDTTSLPTGPLPEVRSVPEGYRTLPVPSDFPTPDKERRSFSREPRIPHIDHQTGALVIEYILPPLCRDGVCTFYTEQILLSHQGKRLTVMWSRVQAPRHESNAFTQSSCKESLVPYVFRSGTAVLIFTVDNSGGITSCKEYQYSQKGETLRFVRTLFPSTRVEFGILQKRLSHKRLCKIVCL